MNTLKLLDEINVVRRERAGKRGWFNVFKDIKVKKTKKGCLVCTSHNYNKKTHYPHVLFKGKSTLISRLIYEFAYGKISKSKSFKKRLFVLHKCDNPKCININHLKLGTQKDNIDDMFRKNRQTNNNGENNGMSKLTPKKIVNMRKLYTIKIKKRYSFKQGFKLNKFWHYERKYPLSIIAKRFKICIACASFIVNRKHWKSIR